MRISDWSSDVCSSDLQRPEPVRLHLRELQHPRLTADLQHAQHLRQRRFLVGDIAQAEGDGDQVEARVGERQRLRVALHVLETAQVAAIGHPRSEERRVGNECVSTCRHRWLAYNLKRKKNNVSIPYRST